jgi:hypothetical protein
MEEWFVNEQQENKIEIIPEPTANLILTWMKNVSVSTFDTFI